MTLYLLVKHQYLAEGKCHSVKSFNAHTCFFIWSKNTSMSLYVLMYVGKYFYIYLHLCKTYTYC